MNETSQETWNATHSQLLKSVADAQARLLAAQNEISDKLTAVVIPVLASLENRLMEAHNNHAALVGRLEKTEALAFSNHALHCSIEKKVFALNGKLDAIGAILAELLTVRRPVARPAKRRRKR